MAKNYQRHARGGKFDRQNFGDLGLRAFKDQQDQIIDSLKRQQLRNEQYSDEYSQGLKGVQSSEKENRQILQSLENKAYETRRRAVEVRGKREVDALEGKAKEYGKQAEFWKDFSTTYSQQYGELAQKTVDTIQKKTASDQMQEQIDNGDFEKSANYFDGLHGILEKDTIKSIAHAYANGDKEALEYAKEVYRKSNRYKAELNSKQLIADAPTSFQDLKEFIRSNGLQWTPDTITQAARTRAKEIMFKFGLKDSKHGLEFYNKFMTLATTEARNVRNLQQANKGADDRSNSTYAAGTVKTQENRLLALSDYNDTPRVDKDNRYSVGVNNPRAAFDEMSKNIIKYYNTEDDYINDMLNTPVLGAYKEWTTDQEVDDEAKWVGPNGGPGTIRERNIRPDKLAEITKQLRDNWAEKIKAGVKQEKKLLEAKGGSEILRLEQKIADKTLDFTTEEGWEEGVKLSRTYEEYEGLEAKYNPLVPLRKAMGMKPGTYDVTIAEADYVKALRDGDWNERSRVINNINNKALRDHYTAADDELQELNSALEELEYTNVNALSKDQFRKASKIGSVDTKLDDSALTLIPELSNRIRSEFGNLKKEDYTTPSARLTKAKEIATQDLFYGDNMEGRGLFQTKKAGEGGVLTKQYIHGMPLKNADTKVPTSVIEETLKSTDVKELYNTTDIISTRATATLARAIDADKTININSEDYDGLRTISALTYTPLSDVVNNWLKSKGYSQRMRKGYHELAVEKGQALGIDVSGHNQNNAMAVIEYTGLVNEFPQSVYELMHPNVRAYYDMRFNYDR